MNSEFEKPDCDGPDDFQSEHPESDRAFDAALQNWGRCRTADTEHLSELKSRVKNICNLNATRSETSKVKKSPASFNRMSWLSLAALLFVGIGTGFAWLNWESENTIVRETQPNLGIAVSDLQNELALTKFNSLNRPGQQELLTRYREIFGNDIRWVSEIDGDVDVELFDPVSNEKDSEYLSVKIVLLSRDLNSADPEWKKIRDISLLAGRERQIVLPASHALAISVWAFPVDNDLVSIDLQYKFQGPIELDLSLSKLQKTGTPTEVYSTTQDGVEYRIYQTAVRLESSELESTDNGLGKQVSSARGLSS